MSNYRRARVTGATYFFTVNLGDRSSDLLVRHIDLLRHSVRLAKAHYPFHIDAWVVLPEHMYCLWTLLEGDGNFSTRWKIIKSVFSRRLPNTEARSATNFARGERGIWQRRYWEHLIRDADDYRRHLDYIHFNPVKHGYVRCVRDWPFSSFHRAIRDGIYPMDWGGNGEEEGGVHFGEWR